ncbi:MAG: hypothetical protein U0223_07185 [Nitrospira sp.]|nr:hypothetical protein [Nitrospira sp.]
MKIVVSPGQHGEDEMKGIAHGQIRRDRHPAIAPFRFQVGYLFKRLFRIKPKDLPWKKPKSRNTIF